MTDKTRDGPQAEQAAKAAELAARLEPKGGERPPNTPTPDEGLNPTPRPDYPPSGALDAEGRRPVVDRTQRPR